MKTAEEWLEYYEEQRHVTGRLSWTSGNLCRAIQADARKELEQQIDAQSNLVCNIQDTCRSRGFMQRPVDEAVIALAQERDTLKRSNAELAAKIKKLEGTHLMDVLAWCSLQDFIAEFCGCEKTPENAHQIKLALNKKFAELAAQVERLMEVLQPFNGIVLLETLDDKQLVNPSLTVHSLRQVQIALSLTPSDALKEYMKPWVECITKLAEEIECYHVDWERMHNDNNYLPEFPEKVKQMTDQASQLLQSVKQ